MCELSNVHLGDYTDESTNQKLTYSDQEIRHINAKRKELPVETISIDEFSEISRDTDKLRSKRERPTRWMGK